MLLNAACISFTLFALLVCVCGNMQINGNWQLRKLENIQANIRFRRYRLLYECMFISTANKSNNKNNNNNKNKHTNDRANRIKLKSKHSNENIHKVWLSVWLLLNTTNLVQM